MGWEGVRLGRSLAFLKGSTLVRRSKGDRCRGPRACHTPIPTSCHTPTPLYPATPYYLYILPHPYTPKSCHTPTPLHSCHVPLHPHKQIAVYRSLLNFCQSSPGLKAERRVCEHELASLIRLHPHADVPAEDTDTPSLSEDSPTTLTSGEPVVVSMTTMLYKVVVSMTTMLYKYECLAHHNFSYLVCL